MYMYDILMHIKDILMYMCDTLIYMCDTHTYTVYSTAVVMVDLRKCPRGVKSGGSNDLRHCYLVCGDAVPTSRR